jgi:hypothetical protein
MAVPAEVILERQRDIKDSESRLFDHGQGIVDEGGAIFDALREITEGLKELAPDTAIQWFQTPSRMRSAALSALDPTLSNMPLDRAIQVLAILTALGLEQTQIDTYRKIISEYEAALSETRSVIALHANQEDRIIWHFVNDQGARSIVNSDYEQGKLDASGERVSQVYTADEFRKRFGLS